MITDETATEIAAEYTAAEERGNADARGFINTMGIDYVATALGAQFGEDLMAGMRIRGMILAVYEAGRLHQMAGGSA